MTAPNKSAAPADTDRREQTRMRLLQAAQDLVGKPDGLRIRIEEVCALARASRGTFYNYFTSIDELFEALWLDLTREQSSRVTARVRRLDSNAERIGTAIRCFLERAIDDRSWGWAMVNLATSGLTTGIDTFMPTTETIKRGVAIGEFAVPDVRAGRDIVVGACLAGMVTILREEIPAHYPAMIADLALRSLGAREN